jgi:5-bromo-4-chloroindolyl phosphate hydrolysis protein
LNKDSKKEELEATLRDQKKTQGSKVKGIKKLMENMQGAYTEVKQMGKGCKIARQIKRMQRQNPGPSQANERPA